MNTSSDNLDEGLIDNYKKLRKTGKEVENMTKPLRDQASKSIGNAFKNLTKGNKKDTNVVKQSDVSKKAAEFTKDYNKTNNITVPKAKKTPITPAMKEKAFKQSFGKPTGADPKTGKGTYKPPKNITNRNLYVDKAGKPTEKGIDKYITNRQTKGKFKGADIKPDTVSKGLTQAAKDIKDPAIRKSTAAQITTKYGGRRAKTVNQASVSARTDAAKDIKANVKTQGNTYSKGFNRTRNSKYSDPWGDDIPNMKKVEPKIKGTYSIVNKLDDRKLAASEKIAPPTQKTTAIKAKPPKGGITFNKFRTKSSVADKLYNDIKRTKAAGPDKVKEISAKVSKIPDDPRMSDINKMIKKGQKTTAIVKSNKQVQSLAKSPEKGGKLTASARGLENTSDLAKSPKVKVSSDGPPPRSAASKMTNFPKKGKVTGSSWVTRGYAKQFGALSGVSGGINKYKQERAKGKGVLASASAGATKGSARGLGTYAGTLVGTKYGGKIGGFIGGTVGGAVGDKAYEVGKNVTKAIGKTFKSFGKSNKYTDTDAYKKLIKPNKPGQKYKSIGIGS